MFNHVLVFFGGGLGSVLRYAIGIYFRNSLTHLPLATFFANLSACLIFAVFLLVSKQLPSEKWSILVLTGFCGGLSTFSTFGYETFLLFRQDLFLIASFNVVGSLVAGLAMFYLLLR